MLYSVMTAAAAALSYLDDVSIKLFLFLFTQIYSFNFVLALISEFISLHYQQNNSNYK